MDGGDDTACSAVREVGDLTTGPAALPRLLYMCSSSFGGLDSASYSFVAPLQPAVNEWIAKTVNDKSSKCVYVMSVYSKGLIRASRNRFKWNPPLPRVGDHCLLCAEGHTVSVREVELQQ
jgi:hypothetical protein